MPKVFPNGLDLRNLETHFGLRPLRRSQTIVTILDMGRTCKTPILNVGVSCTAAISKEKVTLTQVCIGQTAWPRQSLGAYLLERLAFGLVQAWLQVGLFAEIRPQGKWHLAQSEAHLVTASAPEDLIAVKVVWDEKVPSFDRSNFSLG